MIRRCESDLREVRSELEREKRVVAELTVQVTNERISREDHERSIRVATELRETCRALSVEKKNLEGVVVARDAQLETERVKWTKTRDDLAANAKSLCVALEKNAAERRRVEATLATTNESLRAKNEELVASHEMCAKLENARAALEIRARDLMRNNADLTAILFQPRA